MFTPTEKDVKVIRETTGDGGHSIIAYIDLSDGKCFAIHKTLGPIKEPQKELYDTKRQWEYPVGKAVDWRVETLIDLEFRLKEELLRQYDEYKKNSILQRSNRKD